MFQRGEKRSALLFGDYAPPGIHAIGSGWRGADFSSARWGTRLWDKPFRKIEAPTNLRQTIPDALD